MALSTVCRAEKSCTNKTSVKNLQFITNAKPYQFTFYLESTSYFKLFSTKKNRNSKYNGFDASNGNIDDISFYNRYSSLNDYILNKYTVVMENAEKEYRFKQSEIYQRIAERFNPDSFIGLDIVDSRGNIVFYDKKHYQHY